MRVTRALLFLFCMASLCVPGSADELPAAAIIEAKSLAAAGPVPKNYSETVLGSGSLGDIKTVTYRAGDDSRTTSDRGGYHSERGTYHGENWRQDYNGLTYLVPKDPDEAAEDKPKTTVARVTRPVNAYLVTKSAADGSTTRTFYDPVSFHALRYEYGSAAGSLVTTYDEYTTFDTRTLPSRWTATSGPETEHYRRTQYSIGATSDADVRETGIVRQLVEFPNDVLSVDLPVSIIDNAVYVHAKIGTRGLDFELDTGAGGIFIDEQVARSLGLQLTNATSEIAAKAFTGYDTRIPELHIGPLVMRDVAAIAGPMPIRSTQGIKAIGLLGFDFLAQLGVTIDYEHGSVRVAPGANYTPPPPDGNTYSFDLRLGSEVPMVTVSVNGTPAERMMLDTGWSGSLAFFDRFARRHPHVFNFEAGRVAVEGVGGVFDGELYAFRDVKLGQLHFNNFHGVRIPSSNFPLSADGLIGNNLLALFIVNLDYMDGRIYLTPNEAGRRAMSTIAPKK